VEGVRQQDDASVCFWCACDFVLLQLKDGGVAMVLSDGVSIQRLARIRGIMTSKK
jgi:hypothetical protein